LIFGRVDSLNNFQTYFNNLKMQKEPVKRDSLSKILFNKSQISPNLFFYMLEFLTYMEYGKFEKINSQFKKVLNNWDSFTNVKDLIKCTTSHCRKLPEMIFCGGSRDPIKKLLSINPIELREITLQNYFYLLLKGKEKFYFFDNRNFSRNGYIYLSSFLKFNLCGLKELDFFDNEIDTSCAKILFSSLSVNKTIEKLSFSNFSFEENNFDSFREMSECIKQNNFIKYFSIKNYILHPENFEILSEGLMMNNKLLSLDLSNNFLNESSGELIERILSRNTSLKNLVLENNKLRDIGLFYVCLGLKENKTLKCLDLSENEISRIGLQFILDVFKNKGQNYGCYEKLNFYLEELSIRGNNFNDFLSWKLIGGLISSNQSLISLDLSGNVLILKESSEMLADSLKFNNSLKNLDLSSSCLADSGLMILTEGIMKNSNLKTLVLRNCNLTSNCVDNIMGILNNGKNNLRINLSRNSIDENSLLLIKQKMEMNYSNIPIDISSTQ
jgi:Ran GTPase-activating protein (RanGAP) involved in mRNA processing and transport